MKRCTYAEMNVQCSAGLRVSIFSVKLHLPGCVFFRGSPNMVVFLVVSFQTQRKKGRRREPPTCWHFRDNISVQDGAGFRKATKPRGLCVHLASFGVLCNARRVYWLPSQAHLSWKVLEGTEERLGDDSASESTPLGVAQNSRARVTQVLVFVIMYQGAILSTTVPSHGQFALHTNRPFV